MQIPDGTEQLNLNGIRLSLKTLAIIADALERSGSVYVSNCDVQSDSPVSRQLGFEVKHDSSSGYTMVTADPLEGPNDYEGLPEAAADSETSDRASGISA